jgi:hypothetical protein
MTREEWKTRIAASCRSVGTYRPEFDPVIDTLAGVLEKRDKTEDQFERSGGNAVVTHTNKGGASNLVKNPLLVVIGELNAQALAYWRDLGLTPSGLKKINEKALEKRKGNALAEALRELGG